MTKLSVILKEDEVRRALFSASPSAYLKVGRTSKPYKWRLEDPKVLQGWLQAYQIAHDNWVKKALKIKNLDELRPDDLLFAGYMGQDLDPGPGSWRAECMWCFLIWQGPDRLGKYRKLLGGPDRYTMIQAAVSTQCVPLVKLLLEHKFRPNTKGAFGYTALHEACFTGNADVVRCILEGNANVDALSKNGSTALTVAAREGYDSVVSELLRHGAHPDDAGEKHWTPLGIAAAEGHVTTCHLLLTHKADPNGLDVPGVPKQPSCSLYSALQCTLADEVKIQLAQLLLSFKADMHYQCQNDDTPLEYAAREHGVNSGIYKIFAEADCLIKAR